MDVQSQHIVDNFRHWRVFRHGGIRQRIQTNWCQIRPELWQQECLVKRRVLPRVEIWIGCLAP